jgi:hypothetical protein
MGTPDTAQRQRWLLQLAGVFLLAVVVRLILVALVHPQPVSDFRDYERAARWMAEGGLARVRQEWPDFFAVWPPGYPIFILLVRSLVDSRFAVLVAQAFLGALSPVLAMIIAHCLRPERAWLAGLLTALAPGAIVYCGLNASESLAVFLLVSGLALCLAANDNRLLSAAGGIVFGLTSLVRVAATIISVPAMVVLLVAGPRKAWPALVAFFLTILPWSIAQSAHYRAPVFVNFIGQHNLYIYNHPLNETGLFMVLPKSGPLDAKRAGWEMRSALLDIALHPAHYIYLCARRTGVWTGAIADWIMDRYAPSLMTADRVFRGALTIAALAAILAALRARRKELWPLVAGALCYVLATILVSAEVRFVHLALPMLAVLASNLVWPLRSASQVPPR